MNLAGPVPLTPVYRSAEPALSLQPNQRITAEILQVSGDRVALSIQGVTVLARLSSPEQASMLVERQFTQFIVRDVSSQSITLQLANSPAAPAAASQLRSTNLLPRLLQEIGLPALPENISLVRASLSQGLPITPALIRELQQALASGGSWDARDAQLAAWLRACGLPLTRGSLELAREMHPDIGQVAGRLQSLIGSLPGVPAALTEDARAVLMQINLAAGGPAENQPTRVIQAVKLLGRSLEHSLAEAVLNGSSLTVNEAESGSLILARLRAALPQNKTHSLRSALDAFLDGLRWVHFLNALPDSDPIQGRWVHLNLPFQSCSPGKEPGTIHLKVAYDSRGENTRINPCYTRLVFQIDLPAGEKLEVDLSVAGRQVSAEITASSQVLCDLARFELPDLETGLARLGYSMKRSQCGVNPFFNRKSGNAPAAGMELYQSVDREV
ncbi:MAG: hypothetical protein M1281_03185 [Chloroflexi bacterium]|nr:hypothetical protein [Chloroflexota bacterium]